MNSKIQVIAASILAIGLALGLGTVSYGLFSETPTPTKLQTVLDVFTQKGGTGINVSGGNFEPFDNVSILAYLTQGGIKVENRPVTFSIQEPNGTYMVRTASTNDSGLAETDVSLLPSEGHDVIGTWQVLANATVSNEAVNDTLEFTCESQSARIELFSESNGVPSISFLPNETVLLEAQLSYKNASIAGTPVTFDVTTPNDTEFLLQTASTNSLGTANLTFSIPWPSENSLGIWQVSAASEVYGQALNATTFVEFYLPPVIDVFTQEGGVGPNASGGNFTLNETVVLYAEVRDELNQPVPNQMVGFEIIEPNGTNPVILARTTNSSGIANVTFPLPPDPAYLGTFEVYVTTQYYGILLQDTLSFIVTQD
ncbi:MAG TPA: hypothetical protein VEC97_02905 [Candidatus Acidoferrales bacterium]|nr:hypothetical protein [Candidatus Acidoferrales bacterium]